MFVILWEASIVVYCSFSLATDIDECNIPALRHLCLGGYCNNLPRHYECRCPKGGPGASGRVLPLVTGKVPGSSRGLPALHRRG